MSPRPPPKISLRHDHDWTRGNVQLGRTVEQQPVGKIVRQSRGEVQHTTFSQLTQPIPKPICDRSGKPDSTEDVFVVKGETSRSTRSMKKVFTENSVLQIDEGNLIICLKTPVLSKLTMDQGNLMSVTAQVHTVKEQFAPESNRDTALIQRGRRVQPCNQRGVHRLQHSRTTTFCSETIAWRQRSRFDSENQEPPSSTRTSTRSSTTSTIQSIQPRIKRNDS